MLKNVHFWEPRFSRKSTSRRNTIIKILTGRGLERHFRASRQKHQQMLNKVREEDAPNVEKYASGRRENQIFTKKTKSVLNDLISPVICENKKKNLNGTAATETPPDRNDLWHALERFRFFFLKIVNSSGKFQ